MSPNTRPSSPQSTQPAGGEGGASVRAAITPAAARPAYLSGGEADFAQHLCIVLAHPRRPAPYAGALPVGAELDPQGRQAGELAVAAAKAGNEHIDQPARG